MHDKSLNRLSDGPVERVEEYVLRVQAYLLQLLHTLSELVEWTCSNDYGEFISLRERRMRVIGGQICER